ncbi:NERD domain-containing protein [Thiohalorhabdus denitrificans]|uniref:NERD domain-containing protein n=1 Tax=Thiohalorhabdus denitrificans TaxID=381306 RepID=UPI00094240FE
MAYLIPSDLTDLGLEDIHPGESATLRILRDKLPSRYTAFHSVHWSHGYGSKPVFGEIDFVVANNDGEVLLIEQKNGPLTEDGQGFGRSTGSRGRTRCGRFAGPRNRSCRNSSGCTASRGSWKPG